MAGELSRVTVIGARKQVDVAVPANTPIGEYTARLARMCGQDRDPMLPPAWSLAIAGEAAFPLNASLADLSIGDGQVLYLRDLSREPGEAPTVQDLEELVAEEALKARRQMVWSGPAAIGYGLLWIVATVVWVGWHPAAGAAATVCLTILGLLLIGLAWSLGQRGRAVPSPLRLAIALASVPCLAMAGEMVAETLAGPALRWLGVAGGATLAALMALAVIADAILAVVAIQLAFTTAVVSLLMFVEATRIDAAAFVVMAGAGVLGLVRRTAATMTAWANRAMRTRPSAAAVTPAMVGESGRVLALLLLLPAGAMAVALPVLTMSGGGFAIALAATASIGLLARARLAGFAAELLILAGAGLVGVFAVVGALARAISMSAFAEVAVLLALALVMVGIGLGLSLYGPVDPTVPSTTRPPRRRTRAEVLNTICNILIAPLAMGVFGMLGDLVAVGRHLF